jgi:hypothetical protein
VQNFKDDYALVKEDKKKQREANTNIYIGCK